MSKPNIHVAIAILNFKTQILVGWREAKQHQGNKHEFPGGKVEAGETPKQACRREVFEEVGIDIVDWHPFDFIRHEYEDVIVHLHLFLAHVPTNQLDQIRQPWTWYTRPQLLDLNFPKANTAMIQRLYWKKDIKISAELSDLATLKDQQLMYWCVDADSNQVQLLQNIDPQDLDQLIINESLFQALDLALQGKIKTVHLERHQLMSKQKGELIVGKRYLAACSDFESVQHAVDIGCDAVLLGSASNTTTYSERSKLEWAQFESIASRVDIPVFAIGDMTENDLAIAQEYGAYGIARIGDDSIMPSE